MHRFFIPHPALTSPTVRIEGAIPCQIRHVLRLQAGDRVILFCGDGQEHEARIDALKGEVALLTVEASRRPEVELACPLDFGIALLKGDKMDWVIQKLTELGASSIALISTQRAVPLVRARRWPSRLERYVAIAREAVEQSGRVRLPEIRGPSSLAGYLGAARGTLTAIADPSTGRPLHSVLDAAPHRRLRVVIGPEGGFTGDELAAAREAGAVGFTLGKRVLRSETAAVAAAALAVAWLEDGSSVNLRAGSDGRRAQWKQETPEDSKE